MTSPHSSNEGAANSAADQAQIDQLCDDFEAEWKRLVRPQIEEYLDGVDVRLRSQLLEELVRIDHHWRLQESDPDVIRKEYARRFPGDTELIGQWVGSSQAGDASALPGQTSLGPFLNLRRIGEGGFGEVDQFVDVVTFFDALHFFIIETIGVAMQEHTLCFAQFLKIHC